MKATDWSMKSSRKPYGSWLWFILHGNGRQFVIELTLNLKMEQIRHQTYANRDVTDCIRHWNYLSPDSHMLKMAGQQPILVSEKS